MTTETEPDTTTMITLVSCDQERITVSKPIAELSGLVKDMLSNDGDDGDDEEDAEIPLPNVEGAVLKQVVKFCEHYLEEKMDEIPKPLKSPDMKEHVQDWYADFTADGNMEMQMVFKLIVAANYMDVNPLLDLVCATVGSQMKGKTAEEIRETFGIENDFTPEEEEEIRKENKWVEES